MVREFQQRDRVKTCRMQDKQKMLYILIQLIIKPGITSCIFVRRSCVYVLCLCFEIVYVLCLCFEILEAVRSYS